MNRTQAAPTIPANWRVMIDREAPSARDVMLRLLADHQSEAHHCGMCKLCRDAEAALANLH